MPKHFQYQKCNKKKACVIQLEYRMNAVRTFPALIFSSCTLRPDSRFVFWPANKYFIRFMFNSCETIDLTHSKPKSVDFHQTFLQISFFFCRNEIGWNTRQSKIACYDIMGLGNTKEVRFLQPKKSIELKLVSGGEEKRLAKKFI